MTQPIYSNRAAAGRVLATRLSCYYKQPFTQVLALPRGGVPVAYPIAEALALPLDVLVVRKLGIPDYEEVAMGAIASGGLYFFDEGILDRFQISSDSLNSVRMREQEELYRREKRYRQQRPPLNLKHQNIILVDDGLATGASMKVAIAAARQLQAAKIIVAVPVAPADTLQEIAQLVDDVICPATPSHFMAVGCWYEDFNQTSDTEVCRLLADNCQASV